MSVNLTAHTFFQRGSLFALFCGAVSAPVCATEPASVYWGGVEIVPELELTQAYDDNILLQQRNEKSSWLTEIAPSVAARVQTTTIGAELKLQHRAGIYASSSDDNFNDTLADATLIWQPNHRNQWQWLSQFHSLHEQRGTGYSQGERALSLDESNEYDDSNHRLTYTYGGETAKGRLRFELYRNEREYTNNSELAERRDRDVTGANATFFWLIGGRTYALLQGRYSDIDYTTDPTSVAGVFDTLDAASNRLFLGVTWEATGKTKGTIKVGQARRTFDDGDRNDFSGFSWEGELEWSPKEYSVLSLSTAREDRETDGEAYFIDVSQAQASWTHHWHPRFASKVFGNVEVLDYQGDGINREDDVSRIGVSFTYNMRRWLDWSLSIERAEKSSDIPQRDYDRQQVSLSATLSL